jgi:hypothetical protein
MAGAVLRNELEEIGSRPAAAHEAGKRRYRTTEASERVITTGFPALMTTVDRVMSASECEREDRPSPTPAIPIVMAIATIFMWVVRSAL